MVHFFVEDLTFDHSIYTLHVATWLQTVASLEQHPIIDLNYIFCSDSYLLNINQEFLQHDYYTDIITFNNSDVSSYLEGDIFISIDRVQENSTLLHIDFFEELLRVIIHGLLHLLGYDDTTPSSKEIMRQLENKYLLLYFQKFTFK